jgi:hypothetical protein
MKVKFSPSINILRDSDKDIQYYLTPNTERIAAQLVNDFKKGFHAFSIIGSYGTGKSSFLWALQQSLKGKEDYFKLNFGNKKVKFFNWVGEHNSFTEYCEDYFNLEHRFSGNQHIFDAIFKEYDSLGQDGLLVIFADEFGKFLEFGTKHEPEKELYFIQQLAEFVNDSNRNILFICTLHQSFDAYGYELSDEKQRNEWRKVKGRLRELTFNEPVEQLLYLAAQETENEETTGDKANQLINLIEKHHLFSIETEFLKKIGEKLFPLEPISAVVLTAALQKYGQNERSLFTFLKSVEISNRKNYFDLTHIYNYLYHDFYSFINSKSNPHYINWASIREAEETIEAEFKENAPIAIKLIKIIGLLSIFKAGGAKINDEFLESYASIILGIKNVSKILEQLKNHRIIKYSVIRNSYQIYLGSDLDIEEALLNAGKDVNDGLDMVSKLNEHFNFPIITAKSITYKKGTPRLFDFKISEEPLNLIPQDQIDGYINLIASNYLTIEELMEFSSKNEEAVLYGYYNNTKEIRDTLLEIEKTKKVIAANEEDHIAQKELKSILASNEQLLSHYVANSLYGNQLTWVFKGKKIEIKNKKEFNRLLSEICETVYPLVPELNNELLNKHKISASIHAARKNFYNSLAENWNQEDLGFDKHRFPPEKTIYQSLLSVTGIHRQIDGQWELTEPFENSTFTELWKVSEQFLTEAKESKRKITDLFDILGKRPFKLKLGLIEFWIPTFLFIKRGDFALYNQNGYVPELNGSILYLMTRNPKEYYVKSFEISGLRLKLFNRYRALLQQKESDKLSNTGFIESIKPFLTFYAGLNDYSKNTERISKEAILFRKAIISAQDPEATFFEDIPKALNVDLKKLAESDAYLSEYTILLQEKIDELKYAYRNFLDRLETFITQEIVGEDLNFTDYKQKLINRFKDIKEHQLLPEQLTFIRRLSSPIDDRDSWLASIFQTLSKKQLVNFTDEDEDRAKNRLISMIQSLDNLVEISSIEFDEEKEEIVKLDFTIPGEGLQIQTIRYGKATLKGKEKIFQSINTLLDKDKKSKIAILTKLLREELNNGKS